MKKNNIKTSNKIMIGYFIVLIALTITTAFYLRSEILSDNTGSVFQQEQVD